MSYAMVAAFLKLERERKQIVSALCSDELKAKMLAALDDRRRELEVMYGTGNGGAPAPHEQAAVDARKSK